MNIVLKKNAVSSASWYPLYVRKTVYNALVSFSSNIGRVSIYLSRRNSQVKTCLLIIYTKLGERIVIKNSQPNVGLAIQNTIEEARRALSKKIGA